MKFIRYCIEHTKESGTANKTEGYNTKDLPMERQV